MKALLEYIARNLVDKPEAVRIKERTGRFTTTYHLSVAP
ncbi:MAG: RNA-binding protein, partial [Chloroflexus aggregans]